MSPLPEAGDGDDAPDTHYVLQNDRIVAERACPGTPSTSSSSLDLECPNAGADGDADAGCDVSLASSAMTAEELSDGNGFAVVCWMVFLADMSRGVVFPSMWPLIQSLGGTEVDLGWAVAAYSLGRALCAPVYGRWSFSKGYRTTLLITAAILLGGSLLYAQAPRVGSPAYVVFCQTLLGIGSGTLGVSRAYTAEVTAQRAKTTYLSYLSAVQYLGFSVTPVLGSAFIVFFEERDGGFVDEFSAPGLFLALMSIATIALLFLLFEDRRRSKAKTGKKSKKREYVEELAETRTFLGISTHTACLLGCFYLNIVIKGTISVFETLGIEIAKSSFGISASSAGTIVAMCGLVGVVELLAMRRIAAALTDTQIIVGGMGFLALGLCALLGLNDGADNAPWRYILLVFSVYGVGYSVAQAAVLGMFSKVVGRVPQGELMGWFSIAGAGSRVVYPLASGYIVYNRDVGLLAGILIGTLAVSILYVLVNKREFAHLSL